MLRKMGLMMALVAAATALFFWANRFDQVEVARQVAVADGIPLAGPDGKPFTLGDLRGQWRVVLFGYTACPDVCPTSLAYIAAELRRQGHDLPKVVFVSVDPERDHAADLGRYTRSFDPQFLGATGAPSALQDLTKALGAFYEAPRHAADDRHYTVTHDGSLFVLDPAGHLAKTLSPPFAQGELSGALTQVMASTGVP